MYKQTKKNIVINKKTRKSKYCYKCKFVFFLFYINKIEKFNINHGFKLWTIR